MASTPKQTETKTTTEAPAYAQPYIKDALASAQSAINNGNPNYYPGSTVIDLSNETKNAQQSILDTAANGSQIIKNGQNAVNGVTTGAAFNPAGANTLAAGTTFTNGAAGNAQSLSDILAGKDNPATALLQGTANGDYLNGSPGLADAIKRANDPLVRQFTQEIAPGIDSQFAKAGRSGSGAFASVRNNAETTLADAMAKNAGDIAYQDYANERQNQIDASKSIGDLYNTNAQTQIGANTSLASILQGQQDSRNAAASGLMAGQQGQAQTQLQGAGMAGDQRANDYYDANQVAGVGAQKDAYADMLKQADINKWDYNQNKDINNAATMLGLATTGGFNSQTTTKPVYSNGLSSGLGAIGSLASIFGMLCDIRAKENIVFVGYMLNGTRIYEFTYKNDPSGQRYEGPMAQEVEITRPQAVREIDGFKRIDARALIGEAA
ncbi:tail fiber domain-containing protein [Rhizobium sp. 2MFCol3.1]|uniref:tail fiber domain-containing protein n=1 Tax=Rhizobium sp. 2MFCol3.1 TaxID=1246459 RepID=UPI00037DEAE4|nr:tail fiber domain-containing protein [Rhizobium sp. 2MFCol3.1]